jgi:hypothetical protein
LQSPRTLAALFAAALAVAIAGLAAYLWLVPRPAPEAAAAAPAPRPNSARAPRPDARAADPSHRSAADESPAEAAAPLTASVHGRVVDASGKGLPDLLVRASAEESEPSAEARSAADGSFLLVPESLPCLVAVAEPGWTTLCSGEAREDLPLDEVVVVAAPVVALEGMVAGRNGSPLARARVAALLDPSTLAAVTAGRDPALQGRWNASSGNDGAFALDAVPAVPRLHLTTSLSGWRSDERDVDPKDPGVLKIVLEPDDPTGPVLEGTVVHSDGSPAPGALVSLGAARARTDARGAFRLMCSWFGPETPLVACARGQQPAILPAYGARIDPKAQSLPAETLVLPGPELSIEGRVVGPNGLPYKGWSVAIEDGTQLDPGGTSRDLAESEASGRAGARSGSGGVFKITGLAARSYRLLASGRHRLSRAEIAVRSDPIPAGSRGIVLVAPDGNPGEPIRGRVVNLAGAPQSGVLIGLGRPVPETSSIALAWQGPFRTVTDPDGRFEIPNAPACLEFLVVGGDAILPVRLALEPGVSRSGLELRVSSRRELSFEGSQASPRPDRLRALTIAGAPARIWTIEGASPAATWTVLLSGGRSGILAVGEETHEIAVYRGSIELGRLPAPDAGAGTARLTWP